MALNFAGATNITSAGTTTIASIDASGNFSTPTKPHVWVSQNANPTAVGSDILFGLIGYNVGSHYNSANGRFTAPVAGTYHVTYRQLSQNAATAGRYEFGIYLNNVQWLPSYTSKTTTNTWHSNSYRTHIYLNANDYITMRFIAGNSTTYTDGNYVQFSVHLVS